MHSNVPASYRESARSETVTIRLNGSLGELMGQGTLWQAEQRMIAG
jgi:hypothetical protein